MSDRLNQIKAAIEPWDCRAGTYPADAEDYGRTSCCVVRDVRYLLDALAVQQKVVEAARDVVISGGSDLYDAVADLQVSLIALDGLATTERTDKVIVHAPNGLTYHVAREGPDATTGPEPEDGS